MEIIWEDLNVKGKYGVIVSRGSASPVYGMIPWEIRMIGGGGLYCIDQGTFFSVNLDDRSKGLFSTVAEAKKAIERHYKPRVKI